MSENLGRASRTARRIGGGLVAAGVVFIGAIALVPSRAPPKVVAVQVAPMPADAGPPIDLAPLAQEGLVEDVVDHAALASDLIQAGDDRGALAELALAVRQTPDDVELHWKIARLATGGQDLEALREIARLTPADAEPMREIARRTLELDRFGEALPAALEAVRREPSSWEVHQLKGRALLGKGQVGPAINAFRMATRQAGAPSFPFNNLGYALLLAGRPAEALTALDTAIDRGPVTHFMMNNLGLAYERTGRFDEAELAFLGALELKEDYVKASVNLRRVTELKEQVARREAEGEDEPTLEGPEKLGESVTPAEGLPELLHGG